MRDPPLTDVRPFHTEHVSNHNSDADGMNKTATGDGDDSTQTGGAAIS